MKWARLAVCAAALLARPAESAEAPRPGLPSATPPTAVPPAPPADVTQALYALLPLPMHIGDSWRENLMRLWGMRCLPEDSALFSAMDCRSELALGPFSAQSPDGDGISLISDDDAELSRVKSTRYTPWNRQDCDRFQVGVVQALSQAGIASTADRVHGTARVRAGAPGDVQLTVECRPTVQTLELDDSWVSLVPNGDCPDLARAPLQLRALADSAMTGAVHDDFDEMGNACNDAGYRVGEYTGQLMNGLMAAYTVLGEDIPAAPPRWLLNQIHTGLSNVRREATSLRPESRKRFEAFLEREESQGRLISLWSAVRKNRGTVKGPPPIGDRPGRKK